MWAGKSEARTVPRNQSINQSTIQSINQAINSLFKESYVIVVELRNLWPSMKKELRIQYTKKTCGKLKSNIKEVFKRYSKNGMKVSTHL